MSFALEVEDSLQLLQPEKQVSTAQVPSVHDGLYVLVMPILTRSGPGVQRPLLKQMSPGAQHGPSCVESGLQGNALLVANSLPS